MRFVPRREKNRPAVQASRAGAGLDWDTPTNTVGSPSNNELMARKKPFTPVGPKSVDSTTSNYVERKAPAGNEYRLQSYGDD